MWLTFFIKRSRQGGIDLTSELTQSQVRPETAEFVFALNFCFVYTIGVFISKCKRLQRSKVEHLSWIDLGSRFFIFPNTA